MSIPYFIAFPCKKHYSKEQLKGKIMNASKITSKGQTTIPADIRSFLGAKTGDMLEYTMTASGKVEIVLKKRYTWRDLKTVLPKPEKTLSIEEMNEAIIDAAVERHMRSLPKRRKTKK